MTHKELTICAKKWLKKIGCRVVISEMKSSATEEPDAIGWRSGVSILVECKTSRSDFLADAKKIWRRKPEIGLGNWRFYMCEPGLIKAHELPYKWGLLYVEGKGIELIVGPIGNCEWGKYMFECNQSAEIKLLVSALARK